MRRGVRRRGVRRRVEEGREKEEEGEEQGRDVRKGSVSNRAGSGQQFTHKQTDRWHACLGSHHTSKQ